ncbi:MAG: ATP-binding protein [Spirochaetales bacterium]|nr:ATP-binding protein [Spirochaetales bacterium]
MAYLSYNDNFYSQLKIEFSPKLNASMFFRILELVEFPLSPDENTVIKFALTELVTNSIRALHEINSSREIQIAFEINDNYLRFSIIDHAGGFDLARLPYSLEKSINKLNVLADDFQTYRKKHSFKRFGIGLISAKLVFDAFHLSFFDDHENPAPWNGVGSVAGTKITAAKKIDPNYQEHAEIPFMRKTKRYSIFLKAKIDMNNDAYLINISESGAQFLVFKENGYKEGGRISLEILSEHGNDKNMTCDAVIRWIDPGNKIVQLGSEFIITPEFPKKDLEKFIKKIEQEPKLIPGLVVIEGV